ncbi:immunoglobulin superfamily member 10-like [Acropora millepora]|uniref:immunoglobulin superfamily member 10-like n=1 Tax=Acropora millepora TaxID=45264 RepID=UPI001CF370FA|nr:immunoglobulin superfamily member 10-like [Acropora millepora]
MTWRTTPDIQEATTLVSLNGKNLENVRSFCYLVHWLTGDPKHPKCLNQQVSAGQGTWSKDRRFYTDKDINLHTRVKVVEAGVGSRLTYTLQSDRLTGRQCRTVDSVWMRMLRSMVLGTFARNGPDSARITLSNATSSRITEITGKTVIEGGNVTLNCSVEGKPTPSITWTRLSDSRIVTMPLINISRRDVRNYRCTAENGVGAPATRNITIDVQFAPENASLSTNLSTVPVVCAGMVVSFTCSVEASNPAVDTFTLYENGSVISNKIDSGIWIKTLDTGGEVTYECQANNSIGTSSSNKTLFFVEVSASATVESNNIVVREGKDVDLVCNGSGIPSPRIFWLNLSNDIMENGRIWSLHNISRTMAGQYTCIARNSCGNDSQKVDVVVLYPTEATGPGENATEAEGGVKMFSCPVDGNPEPNITWYNEKTGRSISSGKQLEAKEGGCYTCVARNTVGPAVNITQCLIISKYNYSNPYGSSIMQLNLDFSDFFFSPNIVDVKMFLHENDNLYF